MKTLLFYLFLSLLPLPKPAEPAQRLRAFVRDAILKKLTNAELENKYFCTAVLHRPDTLGARARNSLDWTLTKQRSFLRAQRVSAEKVLITPFDQLSAEERPAQPFHMLGDTKHVYVAQYRGKIVLYFLLQENKIASTLLLGQGVEHYFLDFSK